MRFARHQTVALAAIGLIAVTARLALLPWLPVPQPRVHDEFSYLLAADTFAHGRLANPAHPMWMFLDTFRVLQHPTYASIYPPAQGAALAIGQLLGDPWIGVLLSTAAMCVAMTWMLQGWLPPQWALLGGALVLLRFGTFSYWMNSYWGGSVAATGAALALGAFPRALEHRRTRDAIAIGIGMGILATSRPFEGFVFSLPLGLALLWSTFRETDQRRPVLVKRVLMPLVVILALVVAWIGFYNWRVTGNPRTFGHVAEFGPKITTPVFLWEDNQPRRTYANPQFDDYYNQSMPRRYLAGSYAWEKFQMAWQFFLGPVLVIPFLMLPQLLGERRIRLLLAHAAVCALGLWVVIFYYPHYDAPLMAIIVVLLMYALRRMREWRVGGWAVGVAVSRFIVLYCLVIGPVTFIRSLSPVSQADIDAGDGPEYPLEKYWEKQFRGPVERRLSQTPGEHLVVVRYREGHDSDREFVYNKADIDHAKIVWAREIPGVDLSPLLTYFRSRRVWLFEPDEDPSSVRAFFSQSADRRSSASSTAMASSRRP